MQIRGRLLLIHIILPVATALVALSKSCPSPDSIIARPFFHHSLFDLHQILDKGKFAHLEKFKLKMKSR
jgi:hypothetical protein